MSENAATPSRHVLRILSGGNSAGEDVRAAHRITSQFDSNTTDYFYLSRARPLWPGIEQALSAAGVRGFHADARAEMRIVQTGRPISLEQMERLELWPANPRALLAVARETLQGRHQLTFGGQGGQVITQVEFDRSDGQWHSRRYEAQLAEEGEARFREVAQSRHQAPHDAISAALNNLTDPVVLSERLQQRLLQPDQTQKAPAPVVPTPQAPASPRINWVDLSDVNCHIGTYRHPSGKAAFALVDGNGDKDQMIRNAGFEPCDSHIKGAGIYFLAPGQQFTVKELKRHFPPAAVKVINASVTDITNTFQQAIRDKIKMNAEVFFKQRQPLGWNADGYMVFSSPVGRVAEHPKNRMPDGQPFRFAEHTHTIDRPTFFMHANTPEHVRELGRTYIEQVFHPSAPIRISRESYDRFIKITNSSELPRRTYDESMEAASIDVLRTQLAKLDKSAPYLAAFDIAQQLYDGMPPLTTRTGASVALQQYSTPSPIAVLAQRLLGHPDELRQATVLEPTIGNGSLISTLHEAKVFGVEIDPARIRQLPEFVQAAEADATEVSFRLRFAQPDGFRFVIANPPFGDTGRLKNMPLPAGSPEAGMPVRRLDQQILLHSLHARQNKGRAVFITGADNAFDKGDIEGTSRFILNYLHDCYEEVEVVDLSGDMYAKQGAAYPLRLYLIGDRRDQPQVIHTQPGVIPDTMPVVRSYPDLKMWAETVLQRRNERTARLAAEVLAEPSIPTPVEDASPPTPTPEAVEKTGDQRVENDFQIPYVAFSRVTEPTTMVPANLSGVIYEALNDIRNRHGDIDEYVGRELELSLDQLKGRFAAEQVDALAMIFDAQQAGRGFLLADRMGVGKGRVLAAAAVHAHMNGRVPVFFSVTSNLFTDMLERDIVDIGFRDRFRNVLLINGDANTLDADNNVSVKPPPPARLNDMIARQELPPETDLVMLTYSQVARDPTKSKKAAFMAAVAERRPLALLLDESHNAAGESYTSTNIQRMIQASERHGSVLYASATPIKGAKNLAVYSKILPAGVNVDPEELLRAVQADPLSLQEALMHEIAQQGSTIARSLDDSGLQLEFRMSPRSQLHRETADKFAYIMQAMCYLSGDVAKIVSEKNKDFEKMLEKVPAEEREGQRMSATSLNFASRLYNVNRQFLMALQADDVIDYAIETLESNKKPVITIQATGESLLNDFVGTGHEAAQALNQGEGKKRQQTFSDVVLDQPITFSDLLRKYLDRISTITTQTGYGNYSTEPCESEEFIESRKHIAKMIDTFPSLPMTPIDYIRTRLAAKGYSMGEVSGRTLTVDYLQNGGIRITKRTDGGDKTAVNRTVRAFNTGDTDVLLLTGAGSTGLSAHAAPSVGPDTRPRVMIKLELQAAIDKEIQIGGRINRRGQIHQPTYINPLTGLPAQDRLMMMYNTKSRNLSSSSEANRDSKDLIREAPDLLNVVGDEAAKGFLYDNPQLAADLDITLPDPEDSHRQAALWFANKLSSRISLVPVERQEAIYAEWQSLFNDLLERYKAEGRNPLEVKVYDWKAERVDSKVFHGDTTDEAEGTERSMLAMPVYLSTLRYNQVMTPLRVQEIDARIDANRAAVNQHPMVDAISGGVPEIAHYITQHRDRLLASNLAKRFTSVDAALEDKDPNAVKEMAAKIDWLQTNLPRLRVGAVFYRKDIHGNEQPNVVVRFTPPARPEHFTRLSEYTLYSYQPGHDSLDMSFLSSLMTNQIDLQRIEFARHTPARNTFDNAPAGVVPRTARILDGNLFEAVNINLREHLGHKIVYTAINQETGTTEKRHGILVNSAVSDKDLAAIPERVRDTRLLAHILLRYEHPISTNRNADPYHKDTAVALQHGSYGTSISVPAEKSRGGHYFTDPAISLIPGKHDQNIVPLQFERQGRRMVASVRQADVPKLLDYLIQSKGSNFYIEAHTVRQARNILNPQPQNVAPSASPVAFTP